jgi:hypothetical protein
MSMAFKILGAIQLFVGIVLIMGSVGSDCDGDCMENALPIMDMILYSALGLTLAFTGGCMMNYGDKYE